MMVQRRLFELIGEVPWHLAGVVGLGLAAMGTYVAQGLLAARVVGDILSGGAWRTVVPPLIWIAALILVRAGLLWLRDVAAMATAGAVKERLRARLYGHLLELGPGYMARHRTGAVQSVLVDGVEALESYLGFYMPQVLVALLGPALLLASLLTVDPVVAGLVAACVLLVPTAPRLWDRLLARYGEEQWKAQADLAAQFLDSLQGIVTLKAFNASRRRGEDLYRRGLALYRATMAQLSVSMIRNGIVGLAGGAGTALAVGIGALRVVRGELAVPDLLILLFLTGECFRPLGDLDRFWHQGYMGLTVAGRIFGLLDSRPEVAAPPPDLTPDPSPIAPPPSGRGAPPPSPKNVHAAFASLPPLPVEGGAMGEGGRGGEAGRAEAGPGFRISQRPTIAFDRVTFAYDAERPALRELSFQVAPGETVALVGRSGAGKTTVLSLLLRFFDPQEGTIRLDGRDLREIPLAELRRAIAVVSQDTYLFHGSVADNLRLGKPEATPAELEQAARAACIHDFIASLPEGYDTPVGERGLRLSGGERQRLAIARALLKDAPVLLLDEPTSSVDGANEAAIQEALDRLTADRTTLVVAHRLSTVQGADRIVVLDAGGAVEDGGHSALLERQGTYARLVAAQREIA